jgi:hypothetical protein
MMTHCETQNTEGYIYSSCAFKRVFLLLSLLIIQSLVSLQYSCEYCWLQKLYSFPGIANFPTWLKLQTQEYVYTKPANGC